jgi:hypothetical protein
MAPKSFGIPSVPIPENIAGFDAAANHADHAEQTCSEKCEAGWLGGSGGDRRRGRRSDSRCVEIEDE